MSANFFAGHRRHGDFDHRHLGHFAENRYCPRGTRVDLDDIDCLSVPCVLDVYQTDDVQGFDDLLCVFNQLVDDFLWQAVGRIDGAFVAGVNAGALDMFHDARNQHVVAVGDGIYFDFLALHVFVNQNRVLMGRVSPLPLRYFSSSSSE